MRTSARSAPRPQEPLTGDALAARVRRPPGRLLRAHHRDRHRPPGGCCVMVLLGWAVAGGCCWRRGPRGPGGVGLGCAGACWPRRGLAGEGSAREAVVRWPLVMALRRLRTAAAKVHSPDALGRPRTDRRRRPWLCLRSAWKVSPILPAPPVGGDAGRGGQAGGHRRDGIVVCLSGSGGVLGGGACGVLQVAVFPVAMSRSGPGRSGCAGQVAGVGQDQARGRVLGLLAAAIAAGAGAVPASRIMSSYHCTLAGNGEPGGDDQAVGAVNVLRVVSLDEPAAADRHEPGVRVGEVPPGLFPGRPVCGAWFCAGGLPGPGPLEPGPGPADRACLIICVRGCR